jgi:hypothetical protein
MLDYLLLNKIQNAKALNDTAFCANGTAFCANGTALNATGTALNAKIKQFTDFFNTDFVIESYKIKKSRNNENSKNLEVIIKPNSPNSNSDKSHTITLNVHCTDLTKINDLLNTTRSNPTTFKITQISFTDNAKKIYTYSDQIFKKHDK